MIIKKFVAKTEEEAVEAAKKELGSGIVIMNVRAIKPKGIFGWLRAKQTEITVALEEERETLSKMERPVEKKIMSASEEAAEKSEKKTSDSLEKRLDNLQTFLENQLAASERAVSEQEEKESDKQESEEDKEIALSEQDKFMKLLYNIMIDNEVDEKYVNVLLDDMEKTRNSSMTMDFLLAGIYQKMILKFGKAKGICPAEKNPKIVLFLGPTGVGKTTTIAKLASSFAVDQKKKIALFTTDTYRIAAAEQLRTYADILEVPFRVIYTEEEFLQAVATFGEYDYIFVDTAGHSHQNEKQLGDMQQLINAIKDKMEYQCFLVLSATTKYRDLINIAQNYKEITDYQLVFTKLDETTTLGNLYNIKLLTDTPIAYVTYGQNVPSDIEEFDPQKTVKQLLSNNMPDTDREV